MSRNINGIDSSSVKSLSGVVSIYGDSVSVGKVNIDSQNNQITGINNFSANVVTANTVVTNNLVVTNQTVNSNSVVTSNLTVTSNTTTNGIYNFGNVVSTGTIISPDVDSLKVDNVNNKANISLLQSKTQNITAVANSSVFSGNVTISNKILNSEFTASKNITDAFIRSSGITHCNDVLDSDNMTTLSLTCRDGIYITNNGLTIYSGNINSPDINVLNTDNTNNKSNISTLQSDVNLLKTDNTNNKSNISTLQTDVTNNKSNISTLQNKTQNITASSNSTNITGSLSYTTDGRLNTSSGYTLYINNDKSAGDCRVNDGSLSSNMYLTNGSFLLGKQTQKVGIGLTNPTCSLHIKNDTDAQFIIESNSSVSPNQRQLLIGYNHTNNYGWIQPVQQNVGYTNLSLCKDGGFVGIRKTNPSATLDVNGSIKKTVYNSGEIIKVTALNRSSSTIIIANTTWSSTSVGDMFFIQYPPVSTSSTIIVEVFLEYSIGGYGNDSWYSYLTQANSGTTLMRQYQRWDGGGTGGGTRSGVLFPIKAYYTNTGLYMASTNFSVQVQRSTGDDSTTFTYSSSPNTITVIITEVQN